MLNICLFGGTKRYCPNMVLMMLSCTFSGKVRSNLFSIKKIKKLCLSRVCFEDIFILL